jgi:hypothetical protein
MLHGGTGNPICGILTRKATYIGWRIRFLGIDSWALKRLQIRALYSFGLLQLYFLNFKAGMADYGKI